MIGNHAYLIMAHNQPYLLNILLEGLDNSRNHLYVHIDSKSDIRESDIGVNLKHSPLKFTYRTDVHWGGYSQIAAELLLLETAIADGPYQYYHLLTGVDLPLKKQSMVLEFFDSHDGLEFISIDKWREKDLERVVYRYPYQDRLYRGFVEKRVRRFGLILQRMFKLRRMFDIDKWGVGSAYFDITERMAKLVLSKKEWIATTFIESFCADEMFIQTIWLNFGKGYKRFISDNPDPDVEQVYKDVVRSIDWNRGNPYTYRVGDVENLLASEYLFARKFSEIIDIKAIKKIDKYLKQ